MLNSVRCSRRFLPAVALGLAALLAAGCGSAEGVGGEGGAAASGEKVQVTATLPLVGQFAREVGGREVEVDTILQPGDNPHTFQPSPTDARKIAGAQVVFKNGLGLEAWLSGLIQSAKNEDATVVALAQGLQPLGRHAHEHAEGNPHFWLSVPYAQQYVKTIRDTLVEADPQGADQYRTNAQRYLAELENLDDYIRKQVATIPEGNRKLVTFHDAFPYFAETYGFELVGVVLANPNEKPSGGEVADLVRRIQKENVPAIFTEPRFRSSLADTIAGEANVEVYTLYATLAGKGGVIEADVSTYSSMMRANIDNIVQGLG